MQSPLNQSDEEEFSFTPARIEVYEDEFPEMVTHGHTDLKLGEYSTFNKKNLLLQEEEADGLPTILEQSLQD